MAFLCLSSDSADKCVKMIAMTTSIATRVVKARAKTETPKSEAHAEAGNYSKGKVVMHGFKVALENPKGSTRSGVSPDGTEWSTLMKHDYGYINSTVGADGDQVDVFIGDAPDTELVFVVDQNNQDGSFDEHKCMLGFATQAEARKGYLANYDKGWERNVGGITALTIPQFKRWVKSPRTKKPCREQKHIKLASDDLDLSLEQILDVQLDVDFTGCIDTLVEKSAEAAFDLRQAVSTLYTKSDISVYWNPALEKAGLYVRPELDEQEFDWCLNAITEKLGSDHVREMPLTGEDLCDWWVKVAYSPTLRRVAEALQFLPSKDIPGFGGRPIASTIASGLLGAGIGYGGGALLDKITPRALRGEKGRMKYIGMGLGGAAGAGFGAIPGLANWHEGRDFNDNTLWSGFPDDGFDGDLTGNSYKAASEQFVAKMAYQVHPKGISSTMGGPAFSQAPLIRTDALGNVLWGTKADPQTTAMTMGAMYGANRMPDSRSRPGLVTPHQTGLMGMAMGAAGGGMKGYATGYIVGKGLGLLTGMPQSTQNKLKQSGMALGIINSLVPRLFN